MRESELEMLLRGRILVVVKHVTTAIEVVGHDIGLRRLRS